MSTYTITARRTIEALNIDDAIAQFKVDPFGPDAPSKVELVKEPAPQTLGQKIVTTTTALAKDAAVQTGMIEKNPICPDHHVPMQKKPSKFGNGKFYFSCPVKLDDGTYCRAKPQ